MLIVIIGIMLIFVFTALVIACYKLGYADGMSKGMDIMMEQAKRNMETLVSAAAHG